MRKDVDMSATVNHSLDSRILRIRSTARPLLIRTGIPEAPLSTWGTCFLAGYADRTFVITAAHLVGSNASTEILISPMEGSPIWLPLSNGYSLIGDVDEDPSEYDVVAYEFFRHDLPDSVMENTRLLHLDSPETLNWMPTSYVTQFFLFGFPRERNEVDYDAQDVQISQTLLAGKYEGMSNFQRTIHSIVVENPTNLMEFAGFSGSPVLSLQQRIGSPSIVRFCGIAISGSPASGRVHFIETSVITDLLDTSIGHAQTFGHATMPQSG